DPRHRSVARAARARRGARIEHRPRRPGVCPAPGAPHPNGPAGNPSRRGRDGLEPGARDRARGAHAPVGGPGRVDHGRLDQLGGDSPVQSTVLTSTDRGTYNTPIEIYALHSCMQNMDYYLVNTGGTWTPEVAHYESAHVNGGQMRTDAQGNLHVDWENTDAHCTGGIEIAIGPNPDERICRYMDYPLNYEVDIFPPSGPSVVQVNAAPAGDQGESTSYTSGFTFSISGGVDVSGEGPSGGIQAGVSWDNSVTTTVPALVIQAGNAGNQGTFTIYKYCTTGSNAQNCMSSIQMTGQSGLCQDFV